MASLRVTFVHGLFRCLLPLYITRAIIEAYKPTIYLLGIVTTRIAMVKTFAGAVWYNHLSQAPEFVHNQVCSVAKEEIFQPLGFQPKDGFCQRFSVSVMWVTAILFGGYSLRYLWLLPLWSVIRTEGGEFWHALLSDGPHLSLANSYLM